MMSLRFLSAWGPEVRLKRANPSSRQCMMMLTSWSVIVACVFA